ncbi:MAG: phosphoglycerate kinase [Candidatus Binatia bacterium]|nr:phosphoglycerate kinase [Candidatus Binatia bacterium]
MNKKTVRDIAVAGKRVLVRVDFNVPLENGRVADDTRIRAALPTIQYLVAQGAKTILCSHLGRPKGKPDPQHSLRPVAERLSQLLQQPVPLAPDCVGPQVEALVAALRPGELVLLENLRFHAEEEANEEGFARALATLAEVYVNDAFGAAHRAHASTAGVAAWLPAVAGFLMEKELKFLGQALAAPARPFVAILGGAKVSDKIAVIENLLGKVDTLLIGGGMANTFLKAQGREVGDSLVENDKLEVAQTLLHQGGSRLVLPIDVVIADRFAADAQRRAVSVDAVPHGWRILDIGPQTVAHFTRALHGARTVVWNGPMGVFELAPFAEGTFAIARALAELPGATTIVGGGDSAAAAEQAGVAERMTHISTGGGASLEFLEGKVLPGVAVLQDRSNDDR